MLRLDDLDSGESFISSALSQPTRPVAQVGTLVKKHGISVVVPLVDNG